MMDCVSKMMKFASAEEAAAPRGPAQSGTLGATASDPPPPFIKSDLPPPLVFIKIDLPPPLVFIKIDLPPPLVFIKRDVSEISSDYIEIGVTLTLHLLHLH